MPQQTADDFPLADEAKWRALVASALKGKSFDRLISRTYDDIEIAPLYPRRKNAQQQPLRSRLGAWRVAQRIDHPDPFDANRQAREDLAQGADALVLIGAESAAAHGFGVQIRDHRDFAAVLSGIDLDLIALRLDMGAQALDAGYRLLDFARERHLVAAGLDVDIGFDPIGDLLRAGWSGMTIADMAEAGSGLSRGLREAGFVSRVFLADGRPAHEAGASQAQELAYVLAAAVSYLRMLENGGVALDAAFDEIGFLLVADAEQFLTIAKFRALRRLWARVAEACGRAANSPPRIYAETAWRMQTIGDPWVNILRNAMATFSAGIGGADAIAVLPFTLASGLPDSFARRIARNSQLVLLKEAHLADVADPAAGAGSFEDLTDALCEKAWNLFQAIEANGGLVSALRAGMPQAWFKETNETRSRALRQRRVVLTGTSEFPNLAELPVAVLTPRSASGRDARPKIPSGTAKLDVPPIVSLRDSEPFEALRHKADTLLAQRGTRPRVFLANFGTPAEFRARSKFAGGFFAIAGLETGPEKGFTSIDALIAAFSESQAKLACLCTDDAQLAQMGVALVAALQAAGAQHVYVAAPPQTPGLADLQAVTLVHQGCDSVRILGETLDLV